MGLIKRADLDQYTRDACVLDLSDLEKRGKALIEAASRRAEEIIREAHRERDRLAASAAEESREEGFRAGHAEGFERGRAEGAEQARQEQKEALEQLLSLWSEQLGLFEQRRDELLEAARVEVIELAGMIASRVIRRAVELDPGVVGRQMESVLSAVTEPTRLVISVHPDDAEQARAELPALVERFAACEHAQIVTDPTLQRGSCVARTPSGGEIDASIRTQLSRIVEALLPGVGESERAGVIEDAPEDAQAPGARDAKGDAA